MRRLVAGAVLAVSLLAVGPSSAQARPPQAVVPVPIVLDAYPGCATDQTFLRAVAVDVQRDGDGWAATYRDALKPTRVEAWFDSRWIPVSSSEVDGGLLVQGIYGRWRLITPSPWGDSTGPAWSVTPDSCSAFVDSLRWIS